MAVKRVSFFRAATLAVALVGAHGARGQETNITPDTAAGATLGSMVSQNGNTYTIDGGTTSGTNLFHGFAAFDLGAGDVAQWVYSGGDAGSITNVINRITGGTPSSILGFLDATAIPNADFYFINPAGIVFGGDAVVNVPAAAHFSTASELRFANGDVLSIATPSGSTLSVAAPQSFGFLGNEGDILSATNHNLTYEVFFPSANQLTLSGANISIQNGFIGAEEFTLNAVGAGPADVPIRPGSPPPDLGGSIEIRDSWLQTWAVDCYEDCYASSGHIILNGGSILLDWTGLAAAVDSPESGGATSSITLLARDSISFTDATLLADGYTAADAGTVTLQAGETVDIVDSLIFSLNGGSGSGGDISTVGRDVRISNGFITSNGYGSGTAGQVTLDAADHMVLENGSWIQSLSEGDGEAGGVSLTAADLVLTDALVSSEAFGTGNAGTVSVGAGSLTAANSSILTSTHDTGGGGAIDIAVTGDLHLDASAIASNSFRNGVAGDVRVSAVNALLTAQSVISSDGLLDGDAGDLVVVVPGRLQMSDASRISSSGGVSVQEDLAARVDVQSSPTPPPPPPPGGTNPDPPPNLNLASAGTVSVSAGELKMDGFSEIATRSYGVGDGGSIKVTADRLSLHTASIVSDSLYAGDAGDVLVTAGSAKLEWAKINSDAAFTGDAGNVVVSATGPMDMSLSAISSDAGAGYYAASSGHAGTVAVNAGAMSMYNSTVSAAAWSSGNAGAVSVTADSLDMEHSGVWTFSTGAGDAGTVTISLLGDLTMSNSNIASDAVGAGDAGDISISAANATLSYLSAVTSTNGTTGAGGSIIFSVEGELQLTDSEVNAGTSRVATGAGGDVAISADKLMLDGESRVSTNSFGAGHGGRVSVAAGLVTIADTSRISSDAYGDGNAGGVEVSAQQISMTDKGAISSDASSPSGGTAGNVNIVTDDLTMTGGASISTTSANTNAAGNIDIAAAALSMSGAAGDAAVRTHISSENLSGAGGAAGSIAIHSSGVSIADGARVSTNSLTGTAGNINFNMAPHSLLALSGAEHPGIIETSSGPGTGGVITISAPLAIISHGGAISALGESGGANVQIDTNYFIASADRVNTVAVDGTLSFSNAIYDVSAGTADVDLSMLDASSVLQGQCTAVRATGRASQLNIRPSGPFAAPIWPSLIAAKPRPIAAGGGCQ